MDVVDHFPVCNRCGAFSKCGEEMTFGVNLRQLCDCTVLQAGVQHHLFPFGCWKLQSPLALVLKGVVIVIVIVVSRGATTPVEVFCFLFFEENKKVVITALFMTLDVFNRKGHK
jgi:hypothetical protein